MSKRHDPPDVDAVTEQLRRSLRVLGLTHTLAELDAALGAERATGEEVVTGTAAV